MREVTMYYAFDDTEFYNREECLFYEEQIFGYLKEINDKYSFFDKNMNLYCAPLDSLDVEDWMDWFYHAAANCDIIHRKENLSFNTEHFINNEWGFNVLNDDFNKKIGWFKYNFNKYEWEKVDD